jgi:hypothetical protein
MLIGSGIIGVCSYLNVPTMLRVLQTNPPSGLTVEQVQQRLSTFEMSYKIGAMASPLIVLVMLLMFAGLLTAACAVMDIGSKFRDNFSLLAHCGLIGAVGFLAGFFVVRLKGDEIQSLKELRPGFGLDLLLSDGANRFLYAALNYFSLFTIWYIIMMALTLAAMAGIKKGKAFAAVTPVWLVGLIFALVGAIFNR